MKVIRPQIPKICYIIADKININEITQQVMQQLEFENNQDAARLVQGVVQAITNITNDHNNDLLQKHRLLLKELHLLRNTIQPILKELNLNIIFVNNDDFKQTTIGTLSDLISITQYNIACAIINSEDKDIQHIIQQALFHLKQGQLFLCKNEYMRQLIQQIIIQLIFAYLVNELLLDVSPGVQESQVKVIEQPSSVDPQQKSENDNQINTQNHEIHYIQIKDEVFIDIQQLPDEQATRVLEKIFTIQKLVLDNDINDKTALVFRQCDKVLSALCAQGSPILQDLLLNDQLKFFIKKHYGASDNVEGNNENTQKQEFVDYLESQIEYDPKDLIYQSQNTQSEKLKLYKKGYNLTMQKQIDYLQQFVTQYNAFIQQQNSDYLHRERNIETTKAQLETTASDDSKQFNLNLDEFQIPPIQQYQTSVKTMYDNFLTIINTDNQNLQKYSWESTQFQKSLHQTVTEVCQIGQQINKLTNTIQEYQKVTAEDFIAETIKFQEDFTILRKALISKILQDNKINIQEISLLSNVTNKITLNQLYQQFNVEGEPEVRFQELCKLLTKLSQQTNGYYKGITSSQQQILTDLQSIDDIIIISNFNIPKKQLLAKIQEINQMNNSIQVMNQTIFTNINTYQQYLQQIKLNYKQQIEQQFQQYKDNQIDKFFINIPDNILPTLKRID